MVAPRLAFDLGLARRVAADHRHVSPGAPRSASPGVPSRGTGTVVHAGFGWFYDRVPLNVYCVRPLSQRDRHHVRPRMARSRPGRSFSRIPWDRSVRHHQLIFPGPRAGNFSPQSHTWSVQVEQPVGQLLKLRAGYMQNDSDGLVICSIRRARPGDQYGRLSALRRRSRRATASSRPPPACACGGGPGAVLLLRAQPGARRSERFQ